MKKVWTEPEITVLGVNETELYLTGKIHDGFSASVTLSNGPDVVVVATQGVSGSGELAENDHKYWMDHWMAQGYEP